MTIDQGFAAIIAAVIALFASWLAIRSSRINSSLVARQGIIVNDIQDLSNMLYEIIAISVTAMSAKDENTFKLRINQANEIAKKLDLLRRRNRYLLPFIFEAVGELSELPFYFEHYSKEKSSPKITSLKDRATELRKAIDKSLEAYFFHGKSPSFLYRLKLKRLSIALNKEFSDGNPNNKKSL